MNDHWLQEMFKGKSTAELEADLWQSESFGGSDAMVNMLRSELERRGRDDHDQVYSGN